MSRPKGSKNYPKPTDKGNPDFNLNSVSQDDIAAVAAAAVLPEDMAFDAELNRMTASNALPQNIDPDPVGLDLKRELEPRELLSDVMDVSPATTYAELEEQVHSAKVEGCDSIEATLALAKKVIRDPTLEQVGYFLFKDIKVYIEGSYLQTKKRDSQSVEEKTFGIIKR